MKNQTVKPTYTQARPFGPLLRGNKEGNQQTGPNGAISHTGEVTKL